MQDICNTYYYIYLKVTGFLLLLELLNPMLIFLTLSLSLLVEILA